MPGAFFIGALRIGQPFERKADADRIRAEVFLNLDFDVLSGLIEQSLPGFGILFFTGQRRHLGMIQHDGTEAGLFRQGFRDDIAYRKQKKLPVLFLEPRLLKVIQLKLREASQPVGNP